MTDNNTKSNKFNTDNRNSIITDPAVSGNNTISNTNIIPENTKPSKPVYNIQNLKPYNKTDNILSSEEAKRRGINGAKKSAEVRRQRKTMKETMLSMLSMELSPEKLEEMGVDISTLNGDYTMQAAVISAMFRQAVNGSEKAMQLLRDTIGEQPVQKQEIQQEIITKDDIDLMDNVRKQLLSS